MYINNDLLMSWFLLVEACFIQIGSLKTSEFYLSDISVSVYCSHSAAISAIFITGSGIFTTAIVSY